MDDDRSNLARRDRQRIDLEDPDEVRDWAMSLAITQDQLIEAVRTAGSQAVNVRAYLAKMVDSA